jgi:hypothetical protein
MIIRGFQRTINDTGLPPANLALLRFAGRQNDTLFTNSLLFDENDILSMQTPCEVTFIFQ